MNENQHIRLLQGLTGELPADEQKKLREELEGDPQAADAADRIDQVQQVLRRSARTSFGPSFADRVMERLGETARAVSPITEGLTWLFARLAPVAVAVTLALGAYNLSTADENVSTIEAVLGMQPVTTSAAYDLTYDDVAYYQNP